MAVGLRGRAKWGMNETPVEATRHHHLMRRRLLALIIAVGLVATVGGAVLVTRTAVLAPAGMLNQTHSTAPAACSAVAQDDRGTVSAAFTSTVGAILRLPVVASNPQLDGYSSDQAATICYIDGQIPQGPPPGTSGTIPPSFDRAIVVIVGHDTIMVVAGYRQDLPIQAP